MLNVRRRALLPLIIAAHCAVLLLWPTAHRNRLEGARHNATEIFLVPLKMAPSPPSIVAPVAHPAPRHDVPQPINARTKPVKTPQPIGAVPQPMTADRPAPAAATAVLVPEPQPITVAPPLNAESLLQKARSMAGGVDRELRKESWNPRDKNVIQEQSRLAGDIASAFKAQSTTLEEVTMPDGRKMTKIHTPGGTYCGELQSNALTGGRDPFKDGVKTQYHTCAN